MATELTYKIDAQRKLCIKKDLIELCQWIDSLSEINNELTQLKLIEKQLLKNGTIEITLLGVRRKNTLVMATLCKYEQELNSEYKYGKSAYNVTRAKEHERKRDVYTALMQDFHQLKKTIYQVLITYQRR